MRVARRPPPNPSGKNIRSSTERTQACIALYAGGATLREVGYLFGISHERVRILIRQAGYADLRSTARRIDPLRIIAAFRSTGSMSAAAKLVGCHISSVRKVLVALGYETKATKRSCFWARELIIGSLKRVAAELGRAPKIVELGAARGMPSSSTVVRLFGTWNKALEAAGLPTRSSGFQRVEIVYRGDLPPVAKKSVRVAQAV